MSGPESSVPELANFISLAVHRLPNEALAGFLHHWENVIFP